MNSQTVNNRLAAASFRLRDILRATAARINPPPKGTFIQCDMHGVAIEISDAADSLIGDQKQMGDHSVQETAGAEPSTTNIMTMILYPSLDTKPAPASKTATIDKFSLIQSVDIAPTKSATLNHQNQVALYEGISIAPSAPTIESDLLALERNVKNSKCMAQSLLQDIGTELFEEAFWHARAARIDHQLTCHDHKIVKFMNEWEMYERGTVVPQDICADSILCMLKFRETISFLVQDFYQSALENLVGSVTGAASPLSDTEIMRISRALYRIETFRCLYQISTHTNVRDNSHQLLPKMEAWEIEEIATVRDYIFAKLDEIFRDIMMVADSNHPQFDFKKRSKAMPKELSSVVMMKDDELTLDWFSENNAEGIDVKAQDGATPYDPREMSISLGLEFIVKLFRATNPQDRFDVFHECCDVSCEGEKTRDKFLSEALQCMPCRVQGPGRDVEAFCLGREEPFTGDKWGKPNAGWTWANDGRCQLLYDQQCRKELRLKGYVMWDTDRLEKAGLLAQTSPGRGSHGFIHDMHNGVCSQVISDQSNMTSVSATGRDTSTTISSLNDGTQSVRLVGEDTGEDVDHPADSQSNTKFCLEPSTSELANATVCDNTEVDPEMIDQPHTHSESDDTSASEVKEFFVSALLGLKDGCNTASEVKSLGPGVNESNNKSEIELVIKNDNLFITDEISRIKSVQQELEPSIENQSSPKLEPKHHNLVQAVQSENSIEEESIIAHKNLALTLEASIGHGQESADPSSSIETESTDEVQRVFTGSDSPETISLPSPSSGLIIGENDHIIFGVSGRSRSVPFNFEYPSMPDMIEKPPVTQSSSFEFGRQSECFKPFSLEVDFSPPSSSGERGGSPSFSTGSGASIPLTSSPPQRHIKPCKGRIGSDVPRELAKLPPQTDNVTCYLRMSQEAQRKYMDDLRKTRNSQCGEISNLSAEIYRELIKWEVGIKQLALVSPDLAAKYSRPRPAQNHKETTETVPETSGLFPETNARLERPSPAVTIVDHATTEDTEPHSDIDFFEPSPAQLDETTSNEDDKHMPSTSTDNVLDKAFTSNHTVTDTNTPEIVQSTGTTPAQPSKAAKQRAKARAKKDALAAENQRFQQQRREQKETHRKRDAARKAMEQKEQDELLIKEQKKIEEAALAEERRKMQEETVARKNLATEGKDLVVAEVMKMEPAKVKPAKGKGKGKKKGKGKGKGKN